MNTQSSIEEQSRKGSLDHRLQAQAAQPRPEETNSMWAASWLEELRAGNTERTKKRSIGMERDRDERPKPSGFSNSQSTKKRRTEKRMQASPTSSQPNVDDSIQLKEKDDEIARLTEELRKSEEKRAQMSQVLTERTRLLEIQGAVINKKDDQLKEKDTQLGKFLVNGNLAAPMKDGKPDWQAQAQMYQLEVEQYKLQAKQNDQRYFRIEGERNYMESKIKTMTNELIEAKARILAIEMEEKQTLSLSALQMQSVQPPSLPTNSSFSIMKPTYLGTKSAVPSGEKQIVSHITEIDVLFGKDKEHKANRGNIMLKEAVRSTYDEYSSAPRTKRREIAERIVTSFKVQGSRFLKIDPVERTWEEVDDDVAVDKVSVSFRTRRNTLNRKREAAECRKITLQLGNK